MPLDSISSVSSAPISPAMLPAARLSATGRSTSGQPSAEDVKKAAKQFEAILVRQLLAPAVEPMMNGSLGGAPVSGGGVYGYMLTDVLANSISQGGGLGLGRILESQLSSPANRASGT